MPSCEARYALPDPSIPSFLYQMLHVLKSKGTNLSIPPIAQRMGVPPDIIIGAIILATILLGLDPARAFNVSGYEFPDIDRNLAKRPSDNEQRSVYYDDVASQYDNTRNALASTTRALSEVEMLGQTLTGDARQLFEQIPPGKRVTYEQALHAAIEAHMQIQAKHQRLVHRWNSISVELRALHNQIYQAEGAKLRLRREIDAVGRSIEQLRREDQKITEKSPHVAAIEAFARNLAIDLNKNLTKRRREYWDEIARYFRDGDLGLPIDYTWPLQPLQTQTQRRSEVISSIPVPYIAHAAVATPTPIVASWGNAFTQPASVANHSGPVKESDFRAGLDRLSNARRDFDRLSSSADKLLIESDYARRQLKEHIVAEQLASQQRTEVTDARDKLRDEVSWKAWALARKVEDARAELTRCADIVVEEMRWTAATKLLDKSIKGPVAANSVYAHLHLAASITKDLPLVPEVIGKANDRADIQEFLAIDRKRGRTFIYELWDAEQRPMPMKKFFEELFGPPELKD